MKPWMLMLALLGGCAGHASMRGSVVMKATDTDAHVCLGQGEVKTGDIVRLFRNVCVDPRASANNGHVSPGNMCHREKEADGVVVSVFNEHYSLVRFPAGTPFTEGDTVEKHWGR